MKFKIIFLALVCASFTGVAFGENEDTIIIFHTTQGHLAIELFPQDAPNHVKKILNLAEIGFYDGIAFHRVIPGFMIQGGDPATKQNKTIGPGSTLMAEFNAIKHSRGIVSAARTNDPNSANSQFFIVHQNSFFLDKQYTVFGRLVTNESFQTLDKIANLQTSSADRPVDLEKARILKTEILNRDQVPNILKLQAPVGAKPPVVTPKPEPKTIEAPKSTVKAPIETRGPQVDDTASSSDKAMEGGGCLIATAAFGTELSSQVQQLRELRDNTVLKTQAGSSFMSSFNQFYYTFSPHVADLERQNNILKEFFKISLTPMITSLSLLNYVEIDSEEKILGYGIGVIMINIMMYFVFPALIFLKIKNKIYPTLK
ncbi:MAG TPA: peptidylprolyl isomerase [Nitrosopumilaceae archaeon]|nr:peptidylprolyl isomerase [Nitrosopumilaceae archaeon]